MFNIFTRIKEENQKKIPPTSDFRSCLSPVIFWVRMMGIDLDGSMLNRNLVGGRRLGFGALPCTCLIFNFVFQSIWVLNKFKVFIENINSSLTIEDRKIALLLHLPPTICLIFDMILESGVHLIFYVKTLERKWNAVWQSLERAHGELQLGLVFRKRCKRLCYIGFVILFLVR